MSRDKAKKILAAVAILVIPGAIAALVAYKLSRLVIERKANIK